jgi:hypothetical protein
MRTYALTRAEYEAEVDATLADSFPASDPPSWTFGASSWMDLESPAGESLLSPGSVRDHRSAIPRPARWREGR